MVKCRFDIGAVMRGAESDLRHRLQIGGDPFLSNVAVHPMPPDVRGVRTRRLPEERKGNGQDGEDHRTTSNPSCAGTTIRICGPTVKAEASKRLNTAATRKKPLFMDIIKQSLREKIIAGDKGMELAAVTAIGHALCGNQYRPQSAPRLGLLREPPPLSPELVVHRQTHLERMR